MRWPYPSRRYLLYQNSEQVRSNHNDGLDGQYLLNIIRRKKEDKDMVAFYSLRQSPYRLNPEEYAWIRHVFHVAGKIKTPTVPSNIRLYELFEYQPVAKQIAANGFFIRKSDGEIMDGDFVRGVTLLYTVFNFPTFDSPKETFSIYTYADVLIELKKDRTDNAYYLEAKLKDVWIPESVWRVFSDKIAGIVDLKDLMPYVVDVNLETWFTRLTEKVVRFLWNDETGTPVQKKRKTGVK